MSVPTAPEFAPVMQSPEPVALGKVRVDAVDILRGVVMVIMALDHTRDFLTHLTFPPEDMTQTYLALWLTRWVTHFCAPAFFFLAGTGAHFSFARGKSKAQLAHFLWTRGLWLVFLEATVVGFGWTFVAPLGFGGVIWALGWCMVLNAAILRLPLRWVAAAGFAMVGLHNAFDWVQPAMFGKFGWLWMVLHQPGFIPMTPPAWLDVPAGVPFGFFVLYPLVPWAGVMSLGFVFGAVWQRPPGERQRWMLRAGALATLLFIVLRATNLYGNPATAFFNPAMNIEFHLQPTLAENFILFTNVTKYPPSLLFLLMTLGPSLIALALFDRLRLHGRGLLNAAARFFDVFGRVPLFYYLLHLYVIHFLAIAVAMAFGQPHAHLWRGAFLFGPPPPGYGFNLPFIYLVWAVAIFILYWPCKWFMGVKQRRRDWWLSYL